MNVSLRPLELSDKTQLAHLANNKKIWDNVRNRFPHPYSEKNAEEFIQLQNEKNAEKVFAIEYNGKLCGLIGLILQQDVYRKSVEIGYWLGEPFWGKGIATKAVGLIASHAFEDLGSMRILRGCSNTIFDESVGKKRISKGGYCQKSRIQKR